MSRGGAKSVKYIRAKAVREAWEREVALVKQGRATRNWTLAQQKELLDTGRIKGFYGHHVKSVSVYPELAGDPANIQFLTWHEHYQIHLHNWKYSAGHFFDVSQQRVVSSGMYYPMFREVKLTEKLDYQAYLMSKKEQSAMNNEEFFKSEYDKHYQEAHGAISEMYSRNPNASAADMVNAMALNSKYKKFASTQNSKNTLLCIFDGLKRNDSSLKNAFCNSYAAGKFQKEVLTNPQYYSQDGSRKNAELTKFASEMRSICTEKYNEYQKLSEQLEGQRKAQSASVTAQENKELKAKLTASTVTAQLYGQQKSIWDSAIGQQKHMTASVQTTQAQQKPEEKQTVRR